MTLKKKNSRQNTILKRVLLRCNNKLVLIFLFSGLFLITVFQNGFRVLFQSGARFNVVYESVKHKEYDDVIFDKFFIETSGCVIPAMSPFDDSVKKFVEPPPESVVCPNANYSLVKRNKTHIWLNKDRQTLEFYKIDNLSHVICCYRSFYRPDNIDNIYSKNNDDRIKYNHCLFFSDSIVIQDEFVAVICISNKTVIEREFFLSATKKKIDVYDKVKEIPKDKPAFNVLVLGLDGISRMNFHRTMPKTLTYLYRKGAIELQGYNKVGDNSFPNLVPALTGRSDYELKKTCHPDEYTTFDDCPFIWHWYKEAGYYTAFGEDSGFLGTFNYYQRGFLKSPTTYYLHPFFKEAESKAGKLKAVNLRLCLNNNFIFKLLLEYVQDLMETLKSSKLFAFFWEMTMSHDYLNYPMLMDEDYEKFFAKFDSSGYLNQTVVFLMSDHGIRWGGIRKTKQGRLEERLPLMFILTPPSFRKNYFSAYQNLKRNAHRLTTSFDLYETLNDLIDLNKISDDNIRAKKRQSYAHERGISWFLPIPSNRTCKSAGIADHWCTCHGSKNISVESEKAIKASNNLVKHLNRLLEGTPQCTQLEVQSVVAAEEIEGQLFDEDVGEDWKNYLVVVKTRPGGGLFEGTLRCSGKNAWSVTGTVGRLNLYGNQSYCVDNAQLKLYCFCQN